MSKSFSYIIRSSNKTDANDKTGNCWIRLDGLPTQYKSFECEVSNFMFTTSGTYANNVCELRSSFNYLDGYDTNNKSLKTVCTKFASGAYANNNFIFKISNFNSQIINFQLVTDDGSTFLRNGTTFDSPWWISLKMTPIE